ncbi:alpha/beta hydrolase [Streptomyces sp. DG2A-72]|uniref:alpha/beta fold hydrolase n=1 Tax=Streptomyces sp. DG2A-72 TaxID=3051386 RepID=UPI00265C64E6|nr:alpha/beta hydrolase [Streptomyces sp. DG2A-72]MDO0932666.1 alpha/beta hydrolase [Streptomyces sp. DG2A-72]
MNRRIKATAIAALSSVVAGAALIACDGPASTAEKTAGKVTEESAEKNLGDEDRDGDQFSGTKKIRVGKHSVNVSCSGNATEDKPLVMLMAGGGDGLDTMADLQKTLSEKGRVCSYDRLGEGKSDQPNGTQTIDDSAKILTGVLDRLAGDRSVVLVGHSLGGYIAARYAPDHPDRIKGLVLMDATIPALTADISKAIPESATGMAAELRDQTIAVNEGQNPEQFIIADTKVRSAGKIPVQIIKHESQYAEVPEYGPALETMWSKGQQQWRALSSRSTLSTAAGTGHYIHVDRPDIAVEAIQRVAAQAAQAAGNKR